MAAISSIADWNAASLALDGLLNPVIFLTNCSEAARTSSSVTGGSKLNRVLMFLHITDQGNKTTAWQERRQSITQSAQRLRHSETPSSLLSPTRRTTPARCPGQSQTEARCRSAQGREAKVLSRTPALRAQSS